MNIGQLIKENIKASSIVHPLSATTSIAHIPSTTTGTTTTSTIIPSTTTGTTATSMTSSNEIPTADECLIIGQLMFSGEVTAASNWDEPHQFKKVMHALPNSYEDIFQKIIKKTSTAEYGLDLRDIDTKKLLSLPRLQRAIGVIYRPETERWSHYYTCDIIHQFDIIIFHSMTHPVIPLVNYEVKADEVDATFPSGF